MRTLGPPREEERCQKYQMTSKGLEHRTNNLSHVTNEYVNVSRSSLESFGKVVEEYWNSVLRSGNACLMVDIGLHSIRNGLSIYDVDHN